MSDIVERLRGLRFVHIPGTSDLMEEAAAEIERLREAIRRLADQDATLSVQGGNVTVEMDGITLTDAEREAISEAIAAFNEFAGDEVYVRTLRGLLERMR